MAKPLTSSPKASTTYLVEAVDTPKKLTKSEVRELESKVEAYFVKRVKECGLKVLKLNPFMCKGIPDRLVYDPRGEYQHQFVELKRDFKAKASPLQVQLALGLGTLLIHSREEVEMFLMQYYTAYYKKGTSIPLTHE